MPPPKTAEQSWEDMWGHIVSAYKKHLAGRLVYYEFPAHLPQADRSQFQVQSGGWRQHSNDPNQVFVGHMSFETTPERLRYMLHTATQGSVRPTSIMQFPKGCCLVTLGNEEEVNLVHQLEGRLLFDYNGFWLATNEEQQVFMNTCVTACRFPRLPRKWVTFEAPRPMAVPTSQIRSPPQSVCGGGSRGSAGGSGTSSPAGTQSPPPAPRLTPAAGDMPLLSRRVSDASTISPPCLSPSHHYHATTPTPTKGNQGGQPWSHSPYEPYCTPGGAPFMGTGGQQQPPIACFAPHKSPLMMRGNR